MSSVKESLLTFEVSRLTFKVGFLGFGVFVVFEFMLRDQVCMLSKLYYIVGNESYHVA